MNRSRAARPAAPVRAGRRATAPKRARGRHEGVLDLQRAAGNAAVARAIQRYESSEHAELGDAATAKEKETIKVDTAHWNPLKTDNVEFTYSEMLAMGDLFGSPEDFKSASKEQLLKVKELLKRQREKGIDSVTEKEWDDATGGKYLKLAEDNTSHFAGDNKTTWMKYHRQALDLARKKKMNDAFLTNGFGDHFLGDAFSAGHLINKPAAMARAKTAVETGDTAATFATAVATGLLAKAPILWEYEVSPQILPGGWHDMNIPDLAAVIELIRDHEPKKYYSMFAKAVHDDLNSGVKNGNGVEVTNKKGHAPWTLTGDGTLDADPKNPTKEIASAAIEQSRQNIVDAEGAASVDFDTLVAKVWDFTPVPTDAGQKRVDGAEAKLLDPHSPETVAAFVDVAVANFDMLIDKLANGTPKFLRMKPQEIPPAVEKRFEQEDRDPFGTLIDSR